ncbi:hypothetical protein ACOZ4Y_08470 [Komagataeibacter rhaeticus]|uniref:hypothetical protein n=1 Tax=Komagataeibacter rhaeticus TaxID=215221 RepID=UPI001427EB09|nr:hypothetical protein [Komagataeibacter rhaeticus]
MHDLTIYPRADWMRKPIIPTAGYDGRAGFAVQAMTPRRLHMEFSAWVERTRMPPERIQAIRSVQQEAPNEVRTCLEIEADGSFTRACDDYVFAPAFETTDMIQLAGSPVGTPKSRPRELRVIAIWKSPAAILFVQEHNI